MDIFRIRIKGGYCVYATSEAILRIVYVDDGVDMWEDGFETMAEAMSVTINYIDKTVDAEADIGDDPKALSILLSM